MGHPSGVTRAAMRSGALRYGPGPGFWGHGGTKWCAHAPAPD